MLLKNKVDWAWALLFDILIGVTIFFPSISVRSQPGTILGALPENWWGFVLLFIGSVRIAALLINGHWSSTRTAVIRGIAAAFSAAFWGLMLYVVMRLNPWGASQSLFLGILLGNLFCCVNAGYDYGMRRKPKVVTPTAPAPVVS